MGNARNRPQRLFDQLFLIANDPYDRAVRPAAQMSLEPQRFDALEHMLDLLVGRSALQDQDQGGSGAVEDGEKTRESPSV